MRTRVVGLSVAAALAAAHMGYKVRIAQASESPERTPIRVRMEGKKFIPDHLIIKPGDTVEWVNEPDGRTHQVTTDPAQAVDDHNVSSPKGAPLFDSHDIKAGQSFRHQFTVPGVYRYSCPPHEMQGMLGQITVEK